jgi:hypothetical protein
MLQLCHSSKSRLLKTTRPVKMTLFLNLGKIISPCSLTGTNTEVMMMILKMMNLKATSKTSLIWMKGMKMVTLMT